MRAVKLTIAVSCALLFAALGASAASAEFGFKSFAFHYLDPYTKEPTTQAGIHADIATEFETITVKGPKFSWCSSSWASHTSAVITNMPGCPSACWLSPGFDAR